MTVYFKALAALLVFFPSINFAAPVMPGKSPGSDQILYLQNDFYRNVTNRKSVSGHNKSLLERAPGSGSVKIVDLGDDFRAFLTEAENADPETQFAAWNTLEAKYPPHLLKTIFHTDAQGLEAAKKKKLARFMADLPEVKDKTLRLFDAGPAAIKNTFVRFKNAFPDYSENISIYILPSLFTFNAIAWPGAIAFGPDFMVRVGETEEDFPVITSHELFHTYSYSKIPGELKTLAAALWLEGSATYVSGFINPGTSEAAALMDPVLALRCSDPDYVKALAAQYRPLMAKTEEDPEAESLYKTWYQYSNDGTPENPSRKGYCLGLHVFRRLSSKYPIETMMTWPETEFSKAMDATLAEMSAD